MTLPSSGPMTAAMVNTELGRASTAFFNMNGAQERALAGVPSGGYGMNSFYGKSNIPPNTEQFSIVAGQSGDIIGFFQFNYGSLTPGVYRGINVVAANGRLGSGSFPWVIGVTLTGLHAQSLITRLALVGIGSWDSLAFSTDVIGGLSTWNVNGGTPMVNGGSYTLQIGW